VLRTPKAWRAPRARLRLASAPERGDKDPLMTAVAHPAGAFEWEPKREQTLRAARRRSRLIAGLRRFFVAAAGASLASVFVFMALYAVEGGFIDAGNSSSEPLRMLNPRFIGRTEAGGPYQLSAEVAERFAGGEDRPISLVSPVYRTEQGTIMLAPHGVYDEAAKKVTFQGEVLFSDRGGNRFSTPQMVVDLDQGTLYGTAGVTGAGPLGVLQADAYELRQSDRALVLHGNVRGQIPEHRPQNGAQQNGEPKP